MGRAERGVRTVRNQARTMKYVLEQRIGQPIGNENEVTMLSIRWSGMVWRRFHVGTDGRAGYERVMGRTCRVNIV